MNKLIAPTALLVLHTCQAFGQPMTTPAEPGTRSTPAKGHTVQPPKTVAQLIENLKTVMNDESLLTEQFYIDKTVLDVFGADSIEWIQRDREKSHANVIGFRKVVPPARRGNHLTDGLSARFYKSFEDGHTLARVNLRFAEPLVIQLAEIERIFGTGWKPVIRVPLHPPNPLRPTRPMGNSSIEYQFEPGKSRARVELSLWPDESIQTLMLEIKRAK